MDRHLETWRAEGAHLILFNFPEWDVKSCSSRCGSEFFQMSKCSFRVYWEMQETALLLASPHVKISLFILSATASSDAFVLLSTPPWSFPVELLSGCIMQGTPSILPVSSCKFPRKLDFQKYDVSSLTKLWILRRRWCSTDGIVELQPWSCPTDQISHLHAFFKAANLFFDWMY